MSRYTIDYTAEDLDAPFDDNVQIAVVTEGRVELLRALYATITSGEPRTVDVRGHDARLVAGEAAGVPSVALTWEERGGVTVGLVASGLTVDEALAIARNLRTVDEATWRAATGAQQPVVSSAATTMASIPETTPDGGASGGGGTGDAVVTETPVGEVGFPDLDALTGSPVLARGELEGRPWQVRAASLPLRRSDVGGVPQPAEGERLCASIDYAARPMVVLVCDESPALGSGVPGVLALIANDDPRTFLVALVAAGTDGVTVGWADGTSTAVAATGIPGAGGRGVVVVPVARGTRVTSLATSAGRIEVDVPGERGAEIRLPDGAGGQTSFVSGP